MAAAAPKPDPPPAEPIRKARAILIDSNGQLVLFKRTKPGRDVYWVAPGGFVDPADSSVEAALVRELDEELNARADNLRPVFLYSYPGPGGLIVEYCFVARLLSVDESAARRGPEFDQPENGLYEPVRIDLKSGRLDQLNLKPDELKAFIIANWQALINEAAGPGLAPGQMPASR